MLPTHKKRSLGRFKLETKPIQLERQVELAYAPNFNMFSLGFVQCHPPFLVQAGGPLYKSETKYAGGSVQEDLVECKANFDSGKRSFSNRVFFETRVGEACCFEPFVV